MKIEWIEANENDVCSLCGRNHRKLARWKGFLLGTSCLVRAQYQSRLDSPNIGWEKEFYAVKKMMAR